MPAKWIFSSTFLPLAGEPVDFMLEDRDTPISGIFAEGRFHSRWANFDVERVQSWRAVEGDQVVAPIAVVADIAGRRTPDLGVNLAADRQAVGGSDQPACGQSGCPKRLPHLRQVRDGGRYDQRSQEAVSGQQPDHIVTELSAVAAPCFRRQRMPHPFAPR